MSSPSMALAEGRPRRSYFERRLDAARREPDRHAQFAACDEEGRCRLHSRANAGGRIRTRGAGVATRSDRRARRRERTARRRPHVRGPLRRTVFAIGMADVRTQAAWKDHDDAALAGSRGCYPSAQSCRRLRGRRRPVLRRARRSRRPAARRGARRAKSTMARSTGNDFERLARDDAEVLVDELGPARGRRAHRSRASRGATTR